MFRESYGQPAEAVARGAVAVRCVPVVARVVGDPEHQVLGKARWSEVRLKVMLVASR